MDAIQHPTTAYLTFPVALPRVTHMNEPPVTFQSLSPQLRDILQDALSSDRLKDSSRLFDAALLLADRIVRACERDIELGRATEIRTVLTALKQNTRDTPDLPSDKLELWLKALVRLTAPDKYEQRKKTDEGKSTRRFNLFACLEDLQLATPEELNLPGAQILHVADRVTQSIWFAKYDRNNSTHDTGLTDYVLRARITNGMCTAMLAPLILHFEALRRSLRHLITVEPSFGIAVGTNRMVDSERRGHLNRFKGRDDDIRDILKWLEPSPEGGYVLITAEEGTGKSALCAEISERLKARGNTLGAASAKTTREMPWLPGAIVHFGKSARDPEAITAFLVSQINCMILKGLKAPTIAEDGESEVGDGDIIFEPEQCSPVTPNGGTDTPRLEALPKTRRRPAMGGEQMRKALFTALDALSQERGEAVLIIDALDEISEDGSALLFLPHTLPPGVAALITSRANTRAANWAKQHLRISREVALQHLGRNDIPAISGVADDTPGGKDFNDRLYRESDGLPLIAHRLMTGVDTTQLTLSIPRLAGGAAAVFQRQAEEWTTRGPVAKEALIALGLFEPVGTLSLELLQCFLTKVLDQVPDLDDLRRALAPVANQVQGFGDDKLKLSSRPFAVHVHAQHFSTRDLVRRLNAMREVLAEEASVAPSTLAGFLEFWGHHSRHALHRESAAGLVEDLADAQDSKRLLGIAHHFKVWKKDTNDYALPCLRKAAAMGNPTALRILGLMTIDGKCGAADPVEGRRLLELASDKGDVKSLLILGERLLDGQGLPESPEEGLRLLEKAIENKVEKAPMALGMRLLFGHGVPRDAARGIGLLERVANAGDERAMFVIGHFMLEGRLLEKNRPKGSEWLKRAAYAGDADAMVELGERLLQGNEFELDAEAGRAWLDKAVKLGSTRAMTTLSHMLFEGNILPRDINAARVLLTQAAEAGDEQSMCILGTRMLNGEGFPQDTVGGFVWLEKAALNGDDEAAKLVDQEHILRLANKFERAASEEWIRNAFDHRTPEACSQLGFRLYSIDEKQLAEMAFRKSVEGGYVEAGNNLFYMLRRGETRAMAEDADPHALIKSLIERHYAFAVINKALAVAAGFACTVDWRDADALIMNGLVEANVDELVEWWHGLAKKDDPEGHLVLGWVSHHGKAADPDGWPAQRRFTEAVRLGWNVPDWLVGAAKA